MPFLLLYIDSLLLVEAAGQVGIPAVGQNLETLGTNKRGTTSQLPRGNKIGVIWDLNAGKMMVSDYDLTITLPLA